MSFVKEIRDNYKANLAKEKEEEMNGSINVKLDSNRNNVVTEEKLRAVQKHILAETKEFLSKTFGPMGSNTKIITGEEIKTVQAIYSKDGAKVLKTIAVLFKEYKPAAFFNIFAIIFLALALGFGIPVVVEYYKTGLVPRFPTLIVACIFLIIALLEWITGVILQVIVKKHKQLYEILMNILKERDYK